MSEEATVETNILSIGNTNTTRDEMSPTPSSTVHNEIVQEETLEKKDVSSCEYHECERASFSPFKKCNKAYMNHVDYNREVSVITSSTQVISTSQVETYRKQDDSLQAQIECDHINSNSQTSSQTFVEKKTIRSNPFQFSDGVASLTPLKSRRNTITNKLTTIPDEELKPNLLLSRRSLPPLCANSTTFCEDAKPTNQDDPTRGSCLGCNKGKELKILYKELQIMKEKLNQFETELESKRTCAHVSTRTEQNDYTRADESNSDNEPSSPPPLPSSLPVVGRSNTLISQQQNISNKMRINIGGIVHETYRSTIKSIPDTRLTWLARNSARNSPEYNPLKDEFFFDRHPQVFSHILNYYRTGKLHVPYDVCGPLFEEELQFWGIDDTQVESCCWLNYRQHRDAQETLKDFEGIEFDNDVDDESEPDLSKYGFSVDQTGNDSHQRTWYQKWQPYMWKLTEDPHSSKKAKALAYTSVALIMLSVILFCVETIAYFKTPEYDVILKVLEGICVSYFTVELIIRFTFCVNKILFLKNVLNWIDLCANIPFFVNVFVEVEKVPFLQSIRVIRVFRIIKLKKHSIGLQILGHTLRASIRELLLLILFLVIGIIIFSSLLYFCEHEEVDTKFTDIPTTFWWAVITMTTVGYGDMVPTTFKGKIIGTFCSICGVLMIALPVPVIVNNFNLYYSHAQARLKLPKKRRNMLCGAANALRSSEFYDDKAENDVNSETGETRSSIPRIGVETPVTQTAVSIEDEAPSNREQLDNIHSRRMKKFSRRDSNTFVTKSITTPDLALASPRVRNGYALSKRRSLLPSVLPTIDSMPEVEQ